MSCSGSHSPQGPGRDLNTGRAWFCISCPLHLAALPLLQVGFHLKIGENLEVVLKNSVHWDCGNPSLDTLGLVFHAEAHSDCRWAAGTTKGLGTELKTLTPWLRTFSLVSHLLFCCFSSQNMNWWQRFTLRWLRELRWFQGWRSCLLLWVLHPGLPPGPVFNIIQNEVSQEEKHQCSILMRTYGI